MSAGDEIEWGDDIDWDDPDQFAKRKAQLKARRESAEVIFAPDHGRRDDMPPKEEAAPKADGTGNFFAVDRRCFHRACSLGLNPAVAYLIEARGTGRDHATTSWSRTSIQHKAGIRYRSAAEALAALIGDGLARQTKAGARPQYELVPWADHPRFDAREPLSSYDRQFIEKELGEIDGNTRKWARRLAQQGWLKEINLF